VNERRPGSGFIHHGRDAPDDAWTRTDGSLAGGHWALVPAGRRRRAPAREGLIEGYREAGATHVLDQFEANHACYELLSLVRLMHLFEFWFDPKNLPDEQVEAAARNARAALADWL
jgi:hypothetical protein